MKKNTRLLGNSIRESEFPLLFITTEEQMGKRGSGRFSNPNLRNKQSFDGGLAYEIIESRHRCTKPILTISERSIDGRSVRFSCAALALLRTGAEDLTTAVATTKDEVSGVPWYGGSAPSEFYAAGCVFGIKCLGTFDK